MQRFRDEVVDSCFDALVAADKEWDARLIEAFGDHADFRRYTKEGQGFPGTPLRVAYDAKVEAVRAYEGVKYPQSRELVR